MSLRYEPASELLRVFRFRVWGVGFEFEWLLRSNQMRFQTSWSSLNRNPSAGVPARQVQEHPRGGHGAPRDPRHGPLRGITNRERVLYCQPTGPSPPHHLDDFSRPAMRHGSLNSLFRGLNFRTRLLDMTLNFVPDCWTRFPIGHFPGAGCRVQGSGWAQDFWDSDMGCRVQRSWLRDSDLRCRCRVPGFVFGV